MMVMAKWMERRTGPVIFVLMVVCGATGCNGRDDPGVDAGADWGVLKCGAGLVARGPACVPVFDRCKAGEVALYGGKCKRVGPPTSCQSGWKLVTGGWCEPLLPVAKCAKGSMAVLGQATCQPIMDCGSTKYGKIKVTAKTIYVDRQYSKGDSDGSKAKPYQSIDDALAAAPSGAHIAVGAGEYQEDLGITKSVTLEGRCPQMVTVKGYKTDHIATIQISTSDITLRGLTVTGIHIGVAVVSAANVVVERCSISDNLSRGLAVQAKSEVTLRRSVVARNATRGVEVINSKITVEACTIEGTRATKEKDGWMSWGLWVERGEVDVKDSLISANEIGGIGLLKTKGTMTRCLIRDTRDLLMKDATGHGVGIKTNSSFSITRSLISNNRITGITVIDSSATLSESVVRGTLPRRHDETDGTGITVFTSRSTAPCKLVIKDSMISENSRAGVIHVNGGETSIEGSVISGTGAAMGKNSAAVGIWAFTRPSAEHPVPSKTVLKIKHTVVEGGRHMGLAFEGGVEVDLERSVIREIKRPKFATGNMAHGIWLRQTAALTKLGLKSSLKLTESLVEKIEGVGVAAYEDVSVHLVRSQVRDVFKQANDPVAGVAGIGTSSGGPALSVEDSAVSNVPGVGIHLEGATATVTRTQVTGITKPFGDGIAIVHKDKIPKTTLSLDRGMIQNNARAALFFFGSSGTACQSMFQANEFAIVLQEGAAPVICNDNRHENNKRNGVAFGLNLKPATIPIPPDLKD